VANIPTPGEIERLVAVAAAESLTLEFKATPWDRSDQGKREALKDITALANTRGGLILIGITEENNAAKCIAPITAELAEAERSRINDLVMAGVEPRLYGVTIEAVPVEGGAVLVISVRRSPSRPHRVTSSNSNRFWLRNSTGAYEANVADLRSLFLQSADITERAEQYHRERVSALRSSDIVANLSDEPGSIVLHLIHSDAFSGNSPVDPKQAYEIGATFAPLGVFDRISRFTFDGFLNERGGDKCHGYTLVRRNGILEGVKIGLANRRDILPAFQIEAIIANWTLRYVNGLSHLGVVPPFLALVTLEGTNKRRVVYGTSVDVDDNGPITRKDLHLPMVVIEAWDSPATIGDAFKPAFDAMWNAGGHEGSLSYATGRWEQRATV